MTEAHGSGELVGRSAPTASPRASLEELRTAARLSPDGFIAFRASGEVLVANEHAAGLLGRTAEDLVGASVFEHMPPENRADYDDIVANKADTRREYDDLAPRTRAVRTDGEEVPVLATMSPVDVDGETIFVVGMRDAGVQARMHHALTRHAAILEAVAFASNELVRTDDWRSGVQAVLERLGQATNVHRVYVFEVTSDDDADALLTSQRFEWCAPGVEPQIDNPELQDLPFAEAGFDRWAKELAAGRNISGHVEEFPESEQELLLAQDIASIVVVPIHLPGMWWGFMGFDVCGEERLWASAEVDALRTAADVLAAAMERRGAYRALAESYRRYADAYERERVAAEQLRAADELKDLFVETVSHELRTPLAVVRGLAETLFSHVDRLSRDEVAGLLDRMVRHALRLDVLLEDILDLQRLTRGIDSAEPRYVDVAEVVAEVVAGAHLGERPVNLEVASDTVLMDERRFRRILGSLLSNVARHTARTVEVWVECWVGEEDVVLRVADAGAGIPDHFKEAVLQPFVHGPDVARHAPGGGIGLALVARYAEASGGRLEIGDRQGGGAEITVRLPAETSVPSPGARF